MSSGAKEKTAWNRPSTNAYNASSDASLFSSSLPILSHEKLNLNKSNQSGLSLDEDFPILSKLDPKGVVKDPLETIDPSMAGVFLPGDEDELLAGLMDDFDFSGLPTQLEDLDDDFFGSGGGMEIEEDPVNGISRITTSDSIGLLRLPHYGIANGVGIVSGEHPFGEHPSRTLFVRNININVEDSELKSMFEQFGDIRTLYTACKHRGFVMISYYDIRAARSAMLGLQNKPLRRRKLDIHFSIPKDNPSEKDVNQGTLVVFNLDASVSNEELHQIFGAYGEVKEIRETPHKRHHKFIEFYDVRAAEAALKALNKCVIAGKCIKLEPSRPGGTRRSLMLQLSQEQELDEARGLRHPVGSPIGNSPPGIWPNLGSPVEQNSLSGGYSHSPNFGSNPLTGLASILPYHASSPVKITPIGKDPRLSHSNERGGAAYQQHFSVPDQIISSSPRAASSFSDSKPSSVGTLSGPQFLWGSPTIHSDQISSSFLTSSLNPSRSEGIGYPYTNQHGSFLGSRQLHVGSAPSGVQMDRHFGLFPESPESSYMNQTTYGLPNFSHSSLGVSPSSRIMSTLRNSPTYFGGNHGIMDRGRGRADSGSQVDNKVQYQLDLEKIRNGEDNRTTLMIKNIPNKYTSKMLLVTIDETHKGAYDFLYLPIDFKNKCNVGYAFINMVSPFHVISFFEVFNGKKWEKFNSEKVASLAYARIQGKIALVSHFQNSSLMNEDKRCRPIVFQSEGQDYDDLASFSSSNLNIFIRQPDGSYLEDSLDSPEDDPNY